MIQPLLFIRGPTSNNESISLLILFDFPSFVIQECLAIIAKRWCLRELVPMFRIHHETMLIAAMVQSKGMAQLVHHQFHQMVIAVLLP